MTNTRSFFHCVSRSMLLLVMVFAAGLLFGGCASSPSTPPAVKEGMINVPGGRVWYQIVGADRPGIPLLVLHGGPGAPHNYLEPLSSLSDERPVVFYDQLGCGKSDRPTDKSLWVTSRFEDELDAVRNALNLKEIHLYGHSWGSMLAVSYMLDHHPKGVVSLTLAGPALDMDRWVEDQRVWLTEMPQHTQDVIKKCEAAGDFDNPDYQQAVNDYYNLHVCRMNPWPDCVQQSLSLELMGMDEYLYMDGPSEFTITGTLKDFNRVVELKDIRNTPTLFICGKYDEATPGATAFYQHNMPGSEMVVIPNASHLAMVEQPKLYDAAMRAFLHNAEREHHSEASAGMK